MPEARAPGKLLLTGEYAVLGGAPAVAVAIGGPAIATAQDADHWSVASSSADGRWAFDLESPDHVAFRTPPAGGVGDLPAALLTEILRRWPAELMAQPQRLGLDTTAFAQRLAGQPVKLGLGSSSALVVALAGALLKASGIQATPDDFRAVCVAAHRRFQDGRGSGVDVLTAIHGGLLIAAPGVAGLDPEPLPWPADLHLVVAWTGKSASTPELIARYETFQRTEPRVFESKNEALADAARSAAQAWRTGDATAVLNTVAGYGDALRALDEAGGIGIWTDDHQRLASLAAQAGGVYKTSGAGGGDLGYLLSPSPDVAMRFRAAVSDGGQRVLDVTPGQPGLQVTD